MPLLEAAGYHVEFSAVDAPATFREHLSTDDYDIILSEFNLANWTALDALEILEQSGKSIPFIVITAATCEEAAAECMKRGAADYVLKDRPGRIPAAVQQALEIKRLREECKQAEERFTDLLESTEAIVWEADTSTGSFTFVVGPVGATRSCPVDEWLRISGVWADHIHPRDREEALACAREVAEKGEPRSVDYRLRTADGRDVWFHDSMHAVFGPEGKVERLRGIMVNVSTIKRAERE